MTRAWLFASPIQTEFGPSVRFKAPRPGEPDTDEDDRWHCGVDIAAVEDALILAPEPCTIVAVNRGWDGTAKATLVHTESGYTLLLGCTALNSAPPVGTKVPRGGVLAAVGYYTTKKGNHSSMLHLQVYEGLRTPGQVNQTQSWKQGAPQPAALIDPLLYMAGMVPQEGDGGNGQPQVPTPPGPPVETDEPGQTDKNPCTWVDGMLVCQAFDVQQWIDAFRRYHKSAEDAYYLAKLIVDAGEASWNPTTASAWDKITSNRFAIQQLDEGTYEKAQWLPQDTVLDLVSRAQRAVEARDVFLAVKGADQAPTPAPGPDKNPEKKDPPAGGGGGAVVAAAGGLTAIVVTGALLARKRRRR